MEEIKDKVTDIHTLSIIILFFDLYLVYFCLKNKNSNKAIVSFQNHVSVVYYNDQAADVEMLMAHNSLNLIQF